MVCHAELRSRRASAGLLVTVLLVVAGHAGLVAAEQLALEVNAPSASASPFAEAKAMPAGVVAAPAQPGPHRGPPQRPDGKPGEGRPEKKGPDGKKPEEGKGKEGGGDEKKDESAGPKPIKRPESPDVSPRPEELRIEPDKDGKVQFQFHGQKWPAVLTWLADWSGMSLDWQQLPGDFVNLTTSRKYTAREARDLINEHLLTRGYTMLIQDGVLWVSQITKLDPGLVPRVTPAELADRDPHEFVKVSFPLDWLVAETAAKELEPMKSPNGKLSPLTATNRLEAMDSVTNLRQMYALLCEEQSGEGQQHLVRKFVLKHTRAEAVVEQLSTLLGVESKQSSRPKSPQEMQRAAQMAQMRAQQAAQKAKKGGAPPKQKPQVHLVAVPRENSILANAPPDRMALIEQAILAIDVAIDRGNTYRKSIERMYVYRLTSIDAEPLVRTLEEIGNLDFNTRLEVDRQNNTIIAYASLPDHVTIRALIEKLDGSVRQFAVIQLRRLEADYVAGTIRFMMGGKEDKQQERRRPWWDDYGRNDRKQQDQFSVDADVENNRLLLRANESELGQVEDLLVKLGEIPPEQGNPATARVIDAPSDEGLENWLRKIERTWNGPNRLEIDLPTQPRRDDRRGPAAEDRPLTEAKSADLTTSITPDRGIGRPVYRLLAGRHSLPLRRVSEAVRVATESAGPAGPGATAAPPAVPETPPGQAAPARSPAEAVTPPVTPPIKISRAPDGRLIISCQDPVALDRLESLMLEFPPPRKEYEVLRLKYADATYTAMDLEDFFKDETENRRRGGFFFDPWDMYDRGNDSSKPSRLSKRKPLKFIAQIETNSILVQGATPAQITTIRDLITNVFDRRDPVDTKLLRSSRAFKIQYSKARTVAETIKEVYRDLLSANDKSLQNNQRERTERIYSFNYGDSGPKKFKYKGALSIGVDEMSNTLLVSTSPRLMDEVSQMIEYLDEAARPTTTVEVLNTGLGVNGEQLQRTLARMLSERSRGGDSSRRSSEGRSRDGRDGRDGRGDERRRR